MNIWHHLKKPFMILAPMEDVTDTVFRQIVKSCASPDLFFTEFTNVEGLASSKGNPIVSQRLQFTPEEKPIIAQVWGKDPLHYFQAAKQIKKMGYDGIDINMGCPEKSVIKNGCCSALINNRTLAHEIITATQKGAGDLAVSVKTRIGFNTIVTEEWISFLLSHNLQALTIHGRTTKEQSSVPCHWDEIGKAVNIRNQLNSQTPIIGNGDVLTIKEAHEKVKTYHVDGVMIGRGIFHNPFLFSGKTREEISQKQFLSLLEKHVQLYKKTWGNNKNYAVLKKYYKIYIQGFEGAQQLREQLMLTKNYEEAETIIAKLL